MDKIHVWILIFICIGSLILSTNTLDTYSPIHKQKVTVTTYPRAEMNARLWTLFSIVKETNKFNHDRTHDKSAGMFMGRLDTLNSFAILDTDTNPQVTFMASPGAYAIMTVYDQDHYIVGMTHMSGTYEFKRKDSTTRYLLVTVRYFVKDTDDFERVYAYQNQCGISPRGSDKLDVEEFDRRSLDDMRRSIRYRIDTSTMSRAEYGMRGSIDPWGHIVGTYVEIGGIPSSEMIYRIRETPGPYPQKLRLVPPPGTRDTGFWSVTVYNENWKPVYRPNTYVNSKTVRYHPVGSVELTFTDDKSDTDRNTIHVGSGNFFVFRVYQPERLTWDIPGWARR
jgi:hypothetical protein